MNCKRIGLNRSVVLILSVLLINAGAVLADIRLPAIIRDNMVLQQDAEVTIWGWAAPGDSRPRIKGSEAPRSPSRRPKGRVHPPKQTTAHVLRSSTATEDGEDGHSIMSW